MPSHQQFSTVFGVLLVSFFFARVIVFNIEISGVLIERNVASDVVGTLMVQQRSYRKRTAEWQTIERKSVSSLTEIKIFTIGGRWLAGSGCWAANMSEDGNLDYGVGHIQKVIIEECYQSEAMDREA